VRLRKDEEGVKTKGGEGGGVEGTEVFSSE